MSIKKWFINPCNKCLVFACCNQACTKLKNFMQKQSIIWMSLGFIIMTSILIPLIYKFCSIPIALIIFTIFWLVSGVYFYQEILDTSDDNNIFLVIFSFIWLPYAVLSIFIGMMLALAFTKKKNAQFLTSNIWKKEIK